MNKIFIISVIGLLLLVLSHSIVVLEKSQVSKEPLFQGPVRPTDDEEYFRKTGITKPLEVEG